MKKNDGTIVMRTVWSTSVCVVAAALISPTVFAQQDAAQADELTQQNVAANENPASAEPNAPVASDEPAAPAGVETGSAPPADAAEIVPTIPVPDALPEAPTVEAAPDASRQIAEVIVTATKREENLREIPASIAAFSGAELEEQGKLNLNDYVQQTPGVVANSASPGLIRLSVRGISTDSNPTSPVPSPVGIFIGDTAFTDPYLSSIVPDLNAFDLSSVQVLKGPQGTLFGGAALSGAIRYVLQDPVQGEWQGRAFSQYANAHGGSDTFTSGVAVNLPLLPDDGLAARVDYVHRRYPGVYDNVRTGQKDVDGGGGDQLRAIVLWQPTDELKLRLTHLDQDYDADDATTIADSRHGPRATDQILLQQPANNRFELNSFEADYDFDTVRLVSLSSYIEKDLSVFHDYTAVLAGTPIPGYPAAAGAFTAYQDNSHAFSQELRLQSTGPGTLKWLVGAYFYNYAVSFDQLIDTLANQGLTGQDSLLGALPGLFGSLAANINANAALLADSTHAKSQERALFFDVSDLFWERLELSAGARFYRTYVDGGFLANGILARLAGNGSNVDLRNRINENGVNPKLSITYHLTDDALLYGLASRGFRFGGIQSVPSTPTNGVPPTYKSDSLWNYELGLRTNWLDDTVHFDVTGFYIKYKNPQVLQATQGVPLSYYDNVSAAISQGFEASLLWNTPLRGLSLSLSGGLTDAHITKPFTASNGDLIEPGTQLPGAAKSQYSGSLQYLLPVGPLLFGSNVGYTYVGKGYGDLIHSQSINDYGTLNAGISVGSDAWLLKPKLSVNVTNILNETAPVSGSTGNSLIGTPVTSFTLNPPRMLLIRLSVDF